MDSLITAAARALAAGDPLGALKRVALRDDAPALALRGIAMAQLGDFARAKALLRRAARAFGRHEAMARARCAVAEAEIALVSRDLGEPTKALDTARATLEAHGDRANAAYARYLQARRLLLIGHLDDAERILAEFDPATLPPASRASCELVVAGIAIRRLRTAVARVGLNTVRTATIAFGVKLLRAATELKEISGQLNELWQRNVQVASIAYVLARKRTQVNPDTALLTGLLHGVGRLYIMTRAVRHPALPHRGKRPRLPPTFPAPTLKPGPSTTPFDLVIVAASRLPSTRLASLPLGSLTLPLPFPPPPDAAPAPRPRVLRQAVGESNQTHAVEQCKLLITQTVRWRSVHSVHLLLLGRGGAATSTLSSTLGTTNA